jgi:tetratricopeptide (TPR) repeat protein
MQIDLYSITKEDFTMNITNVISDTFSHHIKKAADKLQELELKAAYELIVESIALDPDSPQPQNLLGLWYELSGNADKARRHFRAAYSLDPTYKPACINLERVCTLFASRSIPLDFGVPQEADGSSMSSDTGM